MMRIILFMFFLCFCLKAQTQEIAGHWQSYCFYEVIKYEFSDSNTVTRTMNTSLSSFVFTGKYERLNQMILIHYDPLSSEKRKFYHLKEDNEIENDTLTIINQNKLLVNKRYYIYNKRREQYNFQIDSINNTLSFQIDGFGDSLFLKQYQFNRWITIDTFSAPKNEIIELKNYSLPLHFGLNEFRIDYNQISINRLKTFSINSKKEKVKLISGKKIKDKIEFSDSTYFEIYDSFGKIINRGTAVFYDVSQLKSGKYYLNFDNQTKKIIKD